MPRLVVIDALAETLGDRVERRRCLSLRQQAEPGTRVRLLGQGPLGAGGQLLLGCRMAILLHFCMSIQ